MAQTTIWKDADAPVVYSNLMGFSMTPYDVSLMFGQVESATPDEVTGRPLVKIILSPEQAHNLAIFLGVAVERYVKEAGPLRQSANTDEDTFRKALDKVKVGVE